MQTVHTLYYVLQLLVDYLPYSVVRKEVYFILIAYDSKTGNVERFVKKLNVLSVKVTDELLMVEPFVLITYTTGFGEVSLTTQSFLLNNSEHLKGIAVSGNKNWGSMYCRAANTISKQYSVPILLKFELSGTKEDVEKLLTEVERIDNTNSKVD